MRLQKITKTFFLLHWWWGVQFNFNRALVTKWDKAIRSQYPARDLVVIVVKGKTKLEKPSLLITHFSDMPHHSGNVHEFEFLFIAVTKWHGGQPTAIDRFKFGIDDWVIYRMLEQKNWLYQQVRYYIYNKLKKTKDVPEILEIEPPKNISQYNIFQLFSDGQPGRTSGKTIKNIKEGMTDLRLMTMESQFSLQTAVNYCSFLLSCAYALSAFTFVTPVVGSEMRVGSITRNEGFRFRRVWEIQTPGPPFR